MEELNIEEFGNLKNSPLYSNKPLFVGYLYQSDI